MSDKTICTTCLRLKQGICDGEKELTACPSYKPMTNADRIRAMTDEELAKVIAYACDCDLISGFSCHGECCDCILDWLKQEVSDNG